MLRKPTTKAKAKSSAKAVMQLKSAPKSGPPQFPGTSKPKPPGPPKFPGTSKPKPTGPPQFPGTSKPKPTGPPKPIKGTPKPRKQ